MFMWLRPSPWPGTTKQCSGKDGEDILVDGSASGEICSKTGIIVLFQLRNGGFAASSLLGRDTGLSRVSGITPGPLGGPNTLKMARPLHDCG